MGHFFEWMGKNTETLFWCDSILPDELALGLERGAIAATCNPALGKRCMLTDPELWAPRVNEMKQKFPGIGLQELGLKMLNWTALDGAKMTRKVYDETNGRLGFAVGQVNPSQMDEAGPMTEQAIEATSLDDNMAVKIPATEAGMAVIEEMGARGQTVLSTVSFSTAQAIAAQEAYERGRKRGNVQDPNAINYSVMIVGRLDDYLHEQAKERGLDLPAEVIDMGGLAVTKKINAVFVERGYRGMCLTGGTRMRHVPALAGARMSLTIGMPAQKEVIDLNPEQVERANEPVPEETLAQLRDAFPEFGQAYDVDGLEPSEFRAFPPCQAMHDWFCVEWDGLLDFVAKA